MNTNGVPLPGKGRPRMPARPQAGSAWGRLRWTSLEGGSRLPQRCVLSRGFRNTGAGMRENDAEASVPTYGRRRGAPSSPDRPLPARPPSSLVGGGCTGCPPKSTQKSWPERAFGVLCQQLWSLVPFPKVQEKPQVHRSGDLSSGPGCSTPLPSSLRPALSLASPRSCFSQGQTPPTPAGDKLLWACGNFLPKPAGLTAQQQR